MLVGLYHPQNGKVYYNDVDSNDIAWKILENKLAL
jgi:ABC-type bacteriocin/lantibiotic exporter with double-glycine peptidase domain